MGRHLVWQLQLQLALSKEQQSVQAKSLHHQGRILPNSSIIILQKIYFKFQTLHLEM
jgi:hypothetical protein